MHANGIRMEHSSEVVAEGKFIGKTTYQQRPIKYREIEMSHQLNEKIFLTCKIDFYDPKNNVVHEVKKSDSKEVGHEWQVKFYLWLLQQNGIENATGLIEYPKFKETKEVCLSGVDVVELQRMVQEIKGLLECDAVPGKTQMKYCKNCSYYELCYSNDL